MHYVAGFMFRNEPGSPSLAKEVLLITKRRPNYMAGRDNGIGGGVERGESAVYAMCREMKEETNLDTNQLEDWKCFATKNTTRGDRIDFFAGDYKPRMGHIRQLTDEEISWVRVPALLSHNPYISLKWLIPMAMAYLYDTNRDYEHMTILETK